MARSAEVIQLQDRSRPASAPSEAMAGLPDDNHHLLYMAREIVEVCRSNAGQRTEYYRFLNMVVESGRTNGAKSLLNLMYSLLDRLSAMLYSPTDIRFSLDFENDYDKLTTDRATRVSRLLGRSWETTNSDVQFSQGVFASCQYGAAFMKQWPMEVGASRLPQYRSSILMPWQIGVYRPDLDDLDEQPAIVESSMMTLPEVWRRIWRRPDAIPLFERIKAASASNMTSEANSFSHPVLLASQMQFSQPTRPIAGGIVQIGANGGLDGARADSTAPKVQFHELWLWGRDDYVTIQYFEPDILLTTYRASNMLIPGQNTGLHPFTLIQANQTHGNIWGRSEIADLFMTQDFLSTTMDDIRTMFGLQIDKILAFKGDDIQDEQYNKAKSAGYFNMGMGGDVKDLTPAFPSEAIPLIDKLINLIEMVSGFDNLLSGKGEPGVRSGVQANPMMKTAGARLKDRSLVIERQCAKAVDLRLAMMEAKDGRNYWTDPKNPEATSFLLSDLPEDRRVIVDGHTTSPVFADEHQQLIIGGLKMGLVDKISAIEAMPFPNKDVLIQRIHEAEAKQAALMEQLKQADPEGFAKALEKGLAGGRKR